MESKRNSINLSSYLANMREYSALSGKATFWFGGILSLVEENARSEIVDDLSSEEKVEMLRMASRALASISSFYEQQRPNSVYKLLNFTETLLEQMESSREMPMILARVCYLNTLSIYAVKTHQYAYALNIFAELLEIFQSKVVDTACEPFLVFLSNYLAFLRRSSKKMTSRMLEVEGLLKDGFIKFFSRSLVSGGINPEAQLGSLHLLTALFKQNQSLFSKYEKDVNSLMLHAYQQNLKAKRKVPDDMISYIFREKIKRQLYFAITFSEDEIKFYCAHKPKIAQSMVLRKQEEEEPDRKLTKIEAMLEQSIEMLNEQKLTSARYATLQKNQASRLGELDITRHATLNKSSIDPEPSKNLQTLQPLPRTLTKKRDLPVRPIKPLTKIVRLKAITFKIRSIFIEINEDGVLLSDYTKENKRYIEWNTLSLIMERLELHFPFEEFLKVPVENYYDFVRIIAPFLTKNDSKEICLVPRPLPLLQVNELLRLYKQEGRFLKLALMNHYDAEKFVGVLDCYLSEFDQFFKRLNDNEYLLVLNDRIGKGSTERQREGGENTYLLDYLKRKRETTVAQLSHQLHCEYLERALDEKNNLYKCLFLLKNNMQLFVRIADNIKPGATFEALVVEVRIDNISSIGNETFYLSSQRDISTEKKVGRVLEIPIQKLTYYLPPYGLSPKDYLALYSRPIVDMLNSFEDYADEPNLGGLSFQVRVHASRTETVEYGRYCSLVSVELIGSRERIWAMIVRFYDLAYVCQRVTVLMNPYHQFLQCVVGAGQEERAEMIRHLLIAGSVRETYLWLKRNNKLERRINIFEYLYANQLI